MDRLEPRHLADPVTLEDHAQGRLDADIVLVQYGDYECPYTRLSRYSVQALQREPEYGVLFVFRHFPLDEIHPRARVAAAAAEAAAAQGEFWAMHDHLFIHQQALEARDLHGYAAGLGLDAARFERDRSSVRVAERVERDMASGQRSGVTRTPTFYINGIRHDGAHDVESLRRAIARTQKG